MTTYRQITEAELISFLMEDVFELSGNLRRVGQIIARGEGQTHARWQFLNAAAAGDSTVSDLARRLGLVRQSVQRVADVLVEEGLVAYKDNPHHRRSSLVGLTREGRAVLKRLTRRSQRFRDLVSKKTTKRGLAELRDGVHRLSENVQQVERDKNLARG